MNELQEGKVTEEISDLKEGLRYAEIIQQALLPKERHFKRIFKDSFVFYQPQNYVSGDFYWIGQKDNLKYIAVGDCTGHGISAALLSVLAGNILEYVVMNKGIKKTNKILIELDNKFIESFSHVNDDSFNNDWVDISLCCIDEVSRKIYFSSANRKMFHISKEGKSVLLKGSSYPIGGWQIEKDRSFKATSISYQPGDRIYLGSDGMQDQIGGPKNKKYKSSNLHDFLVKIFHLEMSQQLSLIQEEFVLWKADNPQQDDICIVGIQL
jgi:sigma-B regulation protein RsbU (phosphoserine phosphatase)